MKHKLFLLSGFMLLMALSAGTSLARADVNLTGDWIGTWTALGESKEKGGEMTMKIAQVDDNATGEFSINNTKDGTLEGSFNAQVTDGNFTFIASAPVLKVTVQLQYADGILKGTFCTADYDDGLIQLKRK